MIVSLEDGGSRVGPELRREKLADYWNQYWDFEQRAPELHDTTSREFAAAIDQAKEASRPYLNSQVAIRDVLTRLGDTGTFHRQFRELFPDYHKEQVLGMQLYRLIAADAEDWVYMQSQHVGHAFPHSVYFIDRGGRSRS